VVNSAVKNRIQKSGNIALVVDERLTRDRRGVLSRVVNSMRQYANVQILGGETREEQIIARLAQEPFGLVLAPWHKYVEWNRLDAHFGMTRSSGPTIAGYFCDPIDPGEIGQPPSALRSMVFDFAETQPHEAALLVRALLEERRRTGIRPLLDPTSNIYYESWFHAQGLGARMDSVLGLPEIGQLGWSHRAPAVRVVLSSLWSLVYEEGTGKSELSEALNAGKTARGYMQVGCDQKTLAFRLCYSMPGSSAKNALTSFWPNPDRPTAAAQMLLKYADALRVHTIADGQEIELTAVLFQSAAAEKAHRRLHTLWIEPVSPQLVSEMPFEIPKPEDARSKPLPEIAPSPAPPSNAAAALSATLAAAAAAPIASPAPPGVAPGTANALKAAASGAPVPADADPRDRFVFEAAVKIRELKKQVSERDAKIRELRSGGVGTAVPLPPPDAEALIEAFQQKYFDARHQIRQFELQIAAMEEKGATVQQVEELRTKMTALAKREEDWIRKLATTLQNYKAVRKAAGGTGTGGAKSG
jgi:hypothetical protein